MREPSYTPLALDDLHEIWCYIAEDNAAAADAMQQALRDAASQLVERSSLGHRGRDLTDRDVWFLPVRKKYLLVYRKAKSVEIVRVLHGARDLKSILEE